MSSGEERVKPLSPSEIRWVASVANAGNLQAMRADLRERATRVHPEFALKKRPMILADLAVLEGMLNGA